MNSRIALTGALSYLVLGRRLTARQCFALFLLLLGCRSAPRPQPPLLSLITHPSNPKPLQPHTPATSHALSVASAKGAVSIPSLAMVGMVLVQATLSSLSSVYMEKLLKVEVGPRRHTPSYTTAFPLSHTRACAPLIPLRSPAP